MARRLASTEELELAIPECEKGLGSVILSAESPMLIAGVRVQPFAIYPDDRGYFLEVSRIGIGLAGGLSAGHHPDFGGVELPGHHQGVPFSQASD